MDNDLASQEEGYAANQLKKPGKSRYASVRGYRESFSGKERNHLFLNTPNAEGLPSFVDISGISGMDSPADARSAVLWDYDRDGWLDVAVVNTNTPLLQMWRNQLGDSGQAKGRIVALRFVGSNHTAKPDPARSNRDGFGARVVLDLEDKQLLREHHCGEGMSAQNSNTILVGIGSSETVERLSVRWPAGGQAELQDLPAGSLVTLYEDPSQSPNGEAFLIEDYQPAKPRPAPAAHEPKASERIVIGQLRNRAIEKQLLVYTSIGAECASCVAELPYLNTIQSAMPTDQVAFFGLPMDPQDDQAALKAFAERHQPPYWLLDDITQAERDHVERLIKASDAPLGLGNTIITDAEGRVLKIRYGPTSVSELRALLSK